jgi:hypothetical protein
MNPAPWGVTAPYVRVLHATLQHVHAADAQQDIVDGTP